jgi:hypothetical protein
MFGAPMNNPTPQESPGHHRLPVFGSLAVFGMAAALTSVWFVGPAAGTSAKLENHAVAQLPQVSSASLIDVRAYEQVEAWAKDHVRVKPVAVEAVNNFADVFGSSSKVRIFKGSKYRPSRPNELFLADEFLGRCAVPSIEKARAGMEVLLTAAATGNKRLVIMIAPSKYRVLGDLLGPKLTDLAKCAVKEDEVFIQLAAEYPDNIRYISADRVLAYAPNNPYWAGDSHWTPLGAQAFTEQIVSTVGNIPMQQAQALMARRSVQRGEMIRGELFKLIGESETTSSPVIYPKKRFKAKITFGPNGTNSRNFMWESPYPLQRADESILVIHDSFVNVPALPAQYSQFFKLGYDVHWGSVMSLKKTPAVATVVMESVDRTFMSRLVRLPTVDDAVPDSPDMQRFLTYLRRS